LNRSWEPCKRWKTCLPILGFPPAFELGNALAKLPNLRFEGEFLRRRFSQPNTSYKKFLQL